jgi:hypothetical protein
MADWCESTATAWEVVTLPTVSVEEARTDGESEYIAEAIQHAAMLILADMSDCHIDGGTEWGNPEVDSGCCCGQVKTGIVLASNISQSESCFRITDYEFKLMVTWDKDRHSVQQVALETHRLGRHIPKVVGSLIRPATRRTIHIVQGDNTSSDEDTCPDVVITFAVH